MNNDIKEILEYYRKNNEKYEKNMLSQFNEKQLETTFQVSYQRYKNHKALLDYITNLQEENERLKEILHWKQIENNIFYKSRIDKAIEEKKTPEKITMRAGMFGSINKKLENLNINTMAVEDKINEIIDYLKSKGE